MGLGSRGPEDSDDVGPPVYPSVETFLAIVAPDLTQIRE